MGRIDTERVGGAVKVSWLTVTGIDETIPFKDLAELWGFCADRLELAILLKRKEQQEPRYPSFEFISDFLRLFHKEDGHLALHLCGKACKDFVHGDNGEFPEFLRRHFNRVQLNIGNIDWFLDVDRLVKKMNQLDSIQWIVQVGQAGIAPFHALKQKGAVNVVPLFDASGGRGRVPTAYPEPIPGIFCGYAGGINPETITPTLKTLKSVVGEKSIWLDAESGFRDVDDKFSVNKVFQVLDHILENE